MGCAGPAMTEGLGGALDPATPAPPHNGMDQPVNIPQRIKRLTPLADVLTIIEQLVGPVAPAEVATSDAIGGTLAADLVATAPHPPTALAARDGFAVRAEETLDAGSYGPAPLSTRPVPVETGDALPPGADAVAPIDAVRIGNRPAEALAPIAPGEGVLAEGTDATPGRILRCAGERIRALDATALMALGAARVSVRQPRVHVVQARPDDRVLQATTVLVANAAASDGAIAAPYDAENSQSRHVSEALADAQADAVIVVGGTGTGRLDTSVATLAKLGRVEVHGVGITPGETAAFGMVDKRPVLLVPGRLDAALAAYLTLGRAMVRRLTGGRDDGPPVMAPLIRKVTSTVGLVDVVPVRFVAAGAEPLGSGYLPLSALTLADGYLLVRAASEGFPAGASVAITPLR